ncbi:hypothetical protein MHU86_12230 [Fragilaria crotonensis]|nr:hypothetical protein MHU86_12230 [Fragilaria crotonensis]
MSTFSKEKNPLFKLGGRQPRYCRWKLSAKEYRLHPLAAIPFSAVSQNDFVVLFVPPVCRVVQTKHAAAIHRRLLSPYAYVETIPSFVLQAERPSNCDVGALVLLNKVVSIGDVNAEKSVVLRLSINPFQPPPPMN